jgi:HEAT repeat protein
MIPALIGILVRDDRDDEKPAIPALMDIGAPAVPALLKKLEDKDLLGQRRNSVVLALAAIDTSPRTVALLIDALKDREDDWKAYPVGLIRALAEIGPDAKEAVPLLLEILRRKKDDLPTWRNEAAKALGEIGAGDKKVAAALTEALNDYRTLDAALRGLVLLGPASVPSLADALRSKDLGRSGMAAVALGEIGSASVHVLIETLKEKDVRKQIAVIQALGRIGPPAKDAVPALIELWKTDKNSFFIASQSLRQIDPAAAKKAGVK